MTKKAVSILIVVTFISSVILSISLNQIIFPSNFSDSSEELAEIRAELNSVKTQVTSDSINVHYLNREINDNTGWVNSYIDKLGDSIKALDTTTVKIQQTPVVAEVEEGEEETVEAEQPESTGEVIVPDSQEVKNPVKKISKRKSIFK